MKVRPTIAVFAILFFAMILTSGCFLDNYMIKDSKTGLWRRATLAETTGGFLQDALSFGETLGIIPGWIKILASTGLAAAGVGATVTTVKGKEHKTKRVVSGQILEDIKSKFPETVPFINNSFINSGHASAKDTTFYEKHIQKSKKATNVLTTEGGE